MEKKELSALFVDSPAIAAKLSLEEVLQALVDNASGMAQVSSAILYLVRGEKIYLGAASPPLPEGLSHKSRSDLLSNHPNIEKALDSKSSLFLADVSSVDLSPAERSICEKNSLSSLFYLPLNIEERPVGIMILGAAGRGAVYSDKEIALYNTISIQMAVAVENAILFRENEGYVCDLENSEKMLMDSLDIGISIMEDLQREIEERKNTEIKLRIAKEEAEEATKLKDKFVTLVSHDLKNPIHRAMMYMEMLSSAEKLSAMGSEMVNETIDACDEMTVLINDVLKMSRIRGGKIIPSCSLVNIHEMSNRVIKNYRSMADAKRIEFVNEIPEMKKIYADGKLFLEVMGNLMSNAVKFCREGDVVRLFIPDGEPSTIAVSDTGVGMSKKEQKNLFRYEEKTSTKGTAGEVGTGFGLPLIHEIVKAHGANLHVESSPGKGSTFYVRLTDEKPVIMIVDDEKANRTLLINVLANLDIEFVEAENGPAAIGMLEKQKPILILLDIMMPGMSGFEVLEHVRSQKETEKTPVIVVTADTEISSRDRAFKLGADDFIAKPFRMEDLIPRIRRFVEAY